MSLTHQQLQQVAHLARLQLDEAELPAFQDQLNNILEMVNRLQSIDTQGMEPMAHPLDLVQPLRTDSITEVNQRDSLQSIAPATAEGLYLVPRVIE